jgi:DNA-binding response OmpR family regulator
MTVDTPYQLLIVEDEPDTSAMLQEYFGLQGYQVRVAGWGKEAIAQCQKAPPDLILLDVQLPDMDGYEVYARLRHQLRTRHTPVIFLTERRGRDDRLTGLRLGAVDYMAKPFDLEELLLRVRNALLQAGPPHRAGPTPGLPMALAVGQLRPLVGREEWAALYLRLQNLGAFDEARSFPTRDEVLRTLADTLGEIVAELGSDEDFVAHLSETDFVLVTSPARVDTLQGEIVARLPRALRQLAASRREESRDKSPASAHLSVGIGLLTNADLPQDKGQDEGERLMKEILPLELLSFDF